MKRYIMNCGLLMVPVLLWNLILASYLPPSYTEGDGVSPVLAWSEHGLRLMVFAVPIAWPLQFESPQQRRGFRLYVAGCLVYFASWIPLLSHSESGWSTSAAGLLAPAYTPVIFLFGIAWMASSRWYAALCLAFLALHNVSMYARLHA